MFNHAVYELAPWLAPGFMREIAWHCNRPGRAGVRATVNAMAALPSEKRPDLLRSMWREPAPPNLMSWKAGLHIAWISTAFRVREVAGSVSVHARGGIWERVARRSAFHTAGVGAPRAEVAIGVSG